VARAAVLRRLTWTVAEVVDRVSETPRVHSLTFDVPDWAGHLPGQNIAVRLTAEDVIYADDLAAIARDAAGVSITHTLTRSAPEGWSGRSGRFDREAISELAWPADMEPLTYVCGPTGFVEAVASVLVELGHEPGRILTERFGPTGG
jgi:ferredoxin-NADP reductase